MDADALYAFKGRGFGGEIGLQPPGSGPTIALIDFPFFRSLCLEKRYESSVEYLSLHPGKRAYPRRYFGTLIQISYFQKLSFAIARRKRGKRCLLPSLWCHYGKQLATFSTLIKPQRTSALIFPHLMDPTK